MAKAKNYVYRNLNKGGFSCKVRGKVTARFGSRNGKTGFAIIDGFQVSEVVRQKIVATGKKQVHAYITVDELYETDQYVDVDKYRQIKYNPRTDEMFYTTDGTPLNHVLIVVFQNDRVYGLTSEDFIADCVIRHLLRDSLLKTFGAS